MKRIGRTLGWIVTAWVALTAVTWLLVACLFAVAGDAVQAWDEAAIVWLHDRHDSPLVALSNLVTDLGKPAAAVPMTTFAVLAFSFGLRRRRDGGWILASCVGAGAAYLVLLPIFDRPRPDTVDVSGLGMPSGHAVATLALALPVAVAAWRAWGRRGLRVSVPAMLIALLVGVTRPYIQYHYVSDVIVAWAMTAAWVIALDRWLLPQTATASTRSSSSSSTPRSSSSRASLSRRPRAPLRGP